MLEFDGIDSIDRRIVALMKQNSRITRRELAKKLDISPQTVQNRITALEKNKIILGYTLENIFFLILTIYSTNSGLNSLLGILLKFYKSYSDSVGITIVLQSLSTKNVFNNFLILFFYSTY